MTKRTSARPVWALLTCLSLVPTGAAAAPCDTVTKNWYFPLGNNAIAAATGSDSYGQSPAPPKTYTYVVATDTGSMTTTISRVWQNSVGATTADCSATLPVGEKAVNAPTPVPLSPINGSKQVIFVASSAGKIYRYNFNEACLVSANITPDWVVSMARQLPNKTFLCTSGPLDTITAAPTVQLAAYSSGAGAPAQDLVIVPTHYGCTSTDNRVFALNAATGAVVWKSNMYSAPADYFSDSCTIDYNQNLVYCGAHDPGGPLQSTLFGYRSASAVLNNEPVFQVKPGSISNRIMLRNGMVIVATEEGSVVGYNVKNLPAAPESWRVNLTGMQSPGSVSFRSSPWAEFRYSYRSAILLVDGSGALYRVDESASNDSAARVGAVLRPVYNSATGKFTSTPAVDANLGKVYLSSDFGRVHQVDFSASGFTAASLEASALVETGAQLYDPMLDVTPGATEINRLAVASSSASGAQLRQFTLPWVAGCDSTMGWGAGTVCTQDKDCPVAKYATCAKPQCDLKSGTCKYAFVNNGVACTAGLTCGTGATCSDGICLPKDLTDCCGKESDGNSCGGANSTCCAGKCVTLTSSSACGACGKTCGTDRTCVTTAGVPACERQPSACLSVSTTDAIAKGKNTGTKISSIAFDRDAKRGCNAYVGSTFSTSTIYRFPATGAAETAIRPAISSYNKYPINGVAVTQDGALVSAAQTPGDGKIDANTGIFTVNTANLDNASTLVPVDGAAVTGTAYIDKSWDTGANLTTFSTLVGGNASLIFTANVPKDGQVMAISGSFDPAKGVWTYAKGATVYDGGSTRINAIAFSVRKSNGFAEGTIYAVQGPIMTQVCNAGTNAGKPCTLPTRKLDLSEKGGDYADFADSSGTNGKPGITDILGMSSDPIYGSVLLSARDTKGNLQVLYMDPIGGSVRNYASWPFLTGGKAFPDNLKNIDFRTAIHHNGAWGLVLDTFETGKYTLSSGFGVSR